MRVAFALYRLYTGRREPFEQLHLLTLYALAASCVSQEHAPSYSPDTEKNYASTVLTCGVLPLLIYLEYAYCGYDAPSIFLRVNCVANVAFFFPLGITNEVTTGNL